MATEWLISIDDAAPQPLAALGITGCSVQFAANGEDLMSLTVDADLAADPAFAARTKLALIRRENGDTCVFCGWVRGIPRDAEPGGERFSFVVEGPSSRLRRVSYAQQWKAIVDEAGTVGTTLEPRVILGENNAGARRTTGEQISDVIDYAISKGMPLARGTIAAGLTAPRDERESVSCLDAILAMLRWTPTHVLHWNYNYQIAGVWTPLANVTAAADMPAVDAALFNADVASAQFTPRFDLQAPGVVLTYRITGEKDGKPKEKRRYETAGNITDPEVINLFVDLQGARYDLLTQSVVAEEYPKDPLEMREWLRKLVPWIGDLPPADWMILDARRSGAKRYPRRLVDGALCEWMGEGWEQESITVRVRALTRDDAGRVTEDAVRDIPLTFISTIATTKTYSKNLLAANAEPVPAGLAAAIHAEWSPLHWSGSIEIDEPEPSFAIRPGVVLNLTGARIEWASMRAVVQSVAVDIGSGATSVRVGPCERLEAGSRVAIFRAAKSRRAPSGRRVSEEMEGISGPAATPALDTAAAQAAERLHLAIRGDKHAIDLDPGLVTSASPTTIQPREISVTNAAGETYKVQVLAGQPERVAPTEPLPPIDPVLPPPPCGHPANAPGAGAEPRDPQVEHPFTPYGNHPGSLEEISPQCG